MLTTLLALGILVVNSGFDCDGFKRSSDSFKTLNGINIVKCLFPEENTSIKSL